MESIQKLSIYQLIDMIPENRTFENLQKELTKNHYQLSIKEENDDLIIVYHDNKKKEMTYSLNNNHYNTNFKSCILEKSTLDFIATHFNRVIYNNIAIKILQNIDWENVTISKAYSGISVIVFNHNHNWYIANSKYIYSKKSDKDMFEEAMKNVFTFEELNENYCYYFNWSRPSGISYNMDNKLYHIMTTKKGTTQEVNIIINQNIIPTKNEKYDNCEQLLQDLNNISINDEKHKKISIEGFIIKVYSERSLEESEFKIMKIQTDIYRKIFRMMPKYDNIHQAYLELYQKNVLHDVLPYFTKYKYDISNRIHVSIQTMAKEILNLYHLTRNKKNKYIYDILSNQYKKILYKLHGLYIANKKKYHNKDNLTNFDDIIKFNKSINKFDVYHYIKNNISSKELIQLFYDRMTLIETIKYNNIWKTKSDKVTFLDLDCLNSKMLCYFMFKDHK